MSACCPQLDHFALRFQVDGAVPRRVGVRAIGKRQQRVLNQALKPSTALKMKANEEENDYIFSARMSTPYSQKPNTVGVLAGASVAAAAEFVKKIEHFSSVSGLQGVPLVLCSDPAVQKGLRCANLEMGKAAAVSLREKRRFLESAGACCIVMPCHVSHVWHDEICKEALVPILHIADSVACALADANLKPVERGANVKIGLLAPIHILHAGFYQKRLVDQGFEVIMPDGATMEHIVAPAMEAAKRKDTEGARILLRIALQILFVRGVTKVVLGSYEMRSVVGGGDDDGLLSKCVDPLDALALAAINCCVSLSSQ
eukprot:TRINITY_DN4703_c0_g1_i1.p1 TRINITY_DN4703_c0_g1~~TRINITY_DN4703_c0_g1_i1.p1  ORF type:complete len:315 (-),score=0.12 TRINITY_DN4703_c0_g1_i1:107-1051(-)